MRLKASMAFILLTVLNTTSIWSSDSDPYDQIDKITFIKLAPAQTLEENINEALGDPYFLIKTQLHTRLGGTTRFLVEIDREINFAIYECINNIKKFNNRTWIRAVLQRQVARYNPLLKEAILKSVVSWTFPKL